MNLIIMLIVGGILGWLASMIMRTDGQQGILLNVVVGVVGAVLAGYDVIWSHDGAAALTLIAKAPIPPGLILSDYNLPGGMNGVEVTSKLREMIGLPVPVIILTGDISTAALRNIAEHDCEQLNKPVKPKALSQTVRRMLATPTPERTGSPII